MVRDIQNVLDIYDLFPSIRGHGTCAIKEANTMPKLTPNDYSS